MHFVLCFYAILGHAISLKDIATNKCYRLFIDVMGLKTLTTVMFLLKLPPVSYGTERRSEVDSLRRLRNLELIIYRSREQFPSIVRLQNFAGSYDLTLNQYSKVRVVFRAAHLHTIHDDNTLKQGAGCIHAPTYENSLICVIRKNEFIVNVAQILGRAAKCGFMTALAIEEKVKPL